MPPDPRKEYIPTGELKTKLKEINKAPDYMANKMTFEVRKYKNGGYYKYFQNGRVDSIKKPVAEKLIADKRAGKPNTSHYTVEYVPMKNVKDPKKTLQGGRREKVVKRLQEKTTRTPKTDSNTKTPIRTKFRGKGKAGIALALASLLGLTMSKKVGDKDKSQKEAPKRKAKKPVPTKDTNKRVDSKEEIKKRMQADRDNTPVDYEGDYPIYRKDSAPAKSFRKKYNEEKAKGKKTFTWQGRKYTTK